MKDKFLAIADAIRELDCPIYNAGMIDREDADIGRALRTMESARKQLKKALKRAKRELPDFLDAEDGLNILDE